MNIDTDKVQTKLLGYLSPYKEDISAFMNAYEIRMEEARGYNKDVFTEYFWLSPKALFERIDGGNHAKSDLPKLVKIFYS